MFAKSKTAPTEIESLAAEVSAAEGASAALSAEDTLTRARLDWVSRDLAEAETVTNLENRISLAKHGPKTAEGKALHREQQELETRLNGSERRQERTDAQRRLSAARTRLGLALQRDLHEEGAADRAVVTSSISAAYAALFAMDDRRRELSEAHGEALALTAWEQNVRAALDALASAAGVDRPLTRAEREQRKSLRELKATYKDRERRARAVVEALDEPVKARLQHQSQISQTKVAEELGERRINRQERARYQSAADKAAQKRREARERADRIRRGEE